MLSEPGSLRVKTYEGRPKGAVGNCRASLLERRGCVSSDAAFLKIGRRLFVVPPWHGNSSKEGKELDASELFAQKRYESHRLAPAGAGAVLRASRAIVSLGYFQEAHRLGAKTGQSHALPGAFGFFRRSNYQRNSRNGWHCLVLPGEPLYGQMSRKSSPLSLPRVRPDDLPTRAAASPRRNSGGYYHRRQTVPDLRSLPSMRPMY